MAETVGVEHRGGYYEHAGALRDMVPNHVFQLLAMVIYPTLIAPLFNKFEPLADESLKTRV